MPYCPQGKENSEKRKLNPNEGKGEMPFPQREWPKTKTKIEKSLEKDNRSQLLPHMGVKKMIADNTKIFIPNTQSQYSIH